MADLIREAPFGQLVRLITGNRVFQYPEEKPDFQCPSSYKGGDKKHHHTHHLGEMTAGTNGLAEIKETNESGASGIDRTPQEPSVEAPVEPAIEKMESNIEKLNSNNSDNSSASDIERTATLGLQRTQTVPYTPEFSLSSPAFWTSESFDGSNTSQRSTPSLPILKSEHPHVEGSHDDSGMR